MTLSQSFKKIICDSTRSVSHILQALNELTQLVYLQNVDAPVIAFLPERYQVFQKNQHFFFQRTQDFCYIPDDQEIDISSNIQPSSAQKEASFSGGLIGFVSYDYAAQQHVQVQIKSQPSLFLGLYSSYLQWTDAGWLFCSSDSQAEQIYRKIESYLLQPAALIHPLQLESICQARWTETQYKQAFQQVQEYIKAGDCYQINLTQEFTTKAHGQLLSVVEAFWQLTDAPYSGYLRIDDFELLSCSPELFIDFQAHRKIITKPIKGTMPRFADPVLDEQSKQRLRASEKDQAENVMIVDLLRNDLSVYAETGSVKTPKLFNIESFNQVHHMVSEVEATLKTKVHPFDVLLSALPGGSITGAPKIRAMQIIEELEGAPRGAYCGSMGYFNFDGTGSWNILIRSIQKFQDELSLWAGGGITIASEYEAEYQECFDKVSALLNLLNTFVQTDNE